MGPAKHTVTGVKLANHTTGAGQLSTAIANGLDDSSLAEANSTSIAAGALGSASARCPSNANGAAGGV